MGKRAQKRRKKTEEVKKERKVVLKKIAEDKDLFTSFHKRVDFWVYSFCLIAFISYFFIQAYLAPKGDRAIIATSKGDIEVELYPESAPKTVENFIGLANEGFFEEMIWHRVIDGFMIQSGDPTGEGNGGNSIYGDYFEDEINPSGFGMTDEAIEQLQEKGYNYDFNLESHPVEAGSLAMANSGPNTNLSQFFIVTEKDQPHLSGQHTVFGKVISGLDIAQAISKVEVNEEDKPLEPVYINNVTIK